MTIARIGVYSVPIFYILSGITLHKVYFDRMGFNKKDLKYFLLKRFFRIYPLMWFASILILFLFDRYPGIFHTILSFSGLFAFVFWDNDFPNGIWSVGNELVFYTLFPFIVLLSKRIKSSLFWIFTAGLVVHILYAYLGFRSSLSYWDSWHLYTNPLNQLFFFISGITLSNYSYLIKFSKIINILILLLCTILFVTIPAKGDLLHLIIEENRLYFSFICIGICMVFMQIKQEAPYIVHKPLSKLGEISYSVYLLHPIVYFTVLKIPVMQLAHSDLYWLYVLSVVTLTLIISLFSYRYIERFFINVGSRLVST